MTALPTGGGGAGVGAGVGPGGAGVGEGVGAVVGLGVCQGRWWPMAVPTTADNALKAAAAFEKSRLSMSITRSRNPSTAELRVAVSGGARRETCVPRNSLEKWIRAYAFVSPFRLNSDAGLAPMIPTMLTLYYTPGTCALASHLALEYSGAEYSAVRIDFARQQQRSPEYLRLNPKGRVPALVTPRGVLTETPALLQYIAQAFPRAGLAPLDDAFELARMNEFNSYLCSTVHVAHSHRMRGYRWADDEQAIEAMKRKVAHNIAECFGLIEREMLPGPWVLGDRFSVCDMYLFTIEGWMKSDGVEMAGFPKVADHYARMSAAPVVVKVLAAQRAAA